MYANAPAKCFSNPCKWRGRFVFIEEESQGFLEKPQERVKASQRSLTKRVKLFLEAKQMDQSFLKKTNKRVRSQREGQMRHSWHNCVALRKAKKQKVGRPVQVVGRPFTLVDRPRFKRVKLKCWSAIPERWHPR